MTKEEIQQQIIEMDSYLPIWKIEERLGMPKTTLQKVLSGERTLPKKWVKKLKDYFVPPVKNNTVVTPESKKEEELPVKDEQDGIPEFKNRAQRLVWESEQAIIKQQNNKK